MRCLLFPFAALAAFAAAPVPLARAADSASAPASPLPPLPPLVYRDRTLPNGLRVLSAENHDAPTVAIYVFYKVGSKNDPPGRSGFAHLFEHLMFKSTKNLPAEAFDRLTEDVGGENNAFTQDDMTVYHETIPSNHLERLLWAEAERMSNLNIDEANFHSERAVVEEEYRQSYGADPYGTLNLETIKQSFLVHPYKRPTIGSIPDLETATLADVRQFHDTFYRPDNAVLVVVGDLDPAQFDVWTDKYFGRVAKPATAIPVITAQEPARAKERRVSLSAPNVPLPAAVMTFLTPGIASADAPALRVAANLLSGGESSRLYRSLVYEKRVASSANAEPDLREDAGMFTVEVIAAGGKPIASAETAALAELTRLQTAPVTQEELDKGRNQLLTAALSRRETDDGTALALGDAAVRLGDPARVNTELAALSAVTADDVMRVAKKYLTPANRLTLTYTAAPAPKPAAKPAPAAAKGTTK